MTRKPALRIALWLAVMLCAAFIVARTRYTADLSAFLPRAPSARQELLVDQLREGPASRLLLMGIDGGDADARTQLSMALARKLQLDPAFMSISNGAALSGQHEREFVFKHRYLLSETVTAQRFTVAGLNAAVDDTIALLATPAGVLAKSLLPRDPTGEFLQVLDQLDRTARPPSPSGVWVSPDGKRALLVASLRASGSDIDAAERAVRSVRSAFAEAQRTAGIVGARKAQLLISGPPLFAVTSRATIRQEAVRLSVVSTLLIVSLLLSVYRSLKVLLLGLLPVVCGALVGIAAVALGFGAVHGITLAFGITLIGEAVDYSIYLFVQTRHSPQDAAQEKRRDAALWRTILLGLMTSVFGFASLLPSAFPGLAQLGLYSVAGLIAAAAVTRFVLPALMPSSLRIRDLTPLGERTARIFMRLRKWRWALVVIALLAAVLLYGERNALWNRDSAALSPTPQRAQALDAELRAALGAPDAIDFVVVSGPDMESALRGSEQVAAALDALTAQHVIGGFDAPTRYLPSVATQAARRTSLPDAVQLRERLREATAKLGLRTERLEPFVNDVARARAGPLLTLQDLRGTSLETGVDALLMHQSRQWSALLPLYPAQTGLLPSAADLQKVSAAAARAAPGQALLLNLKSESDALYSGYLSEALRLSEAGLAAIVVLLLVTLRSPARVVRVVAPLLLAVITVAAAILVSGRSLTILHLIGMLLIVAVGSNYALFFDRAAADHAGGTSPLTVASLLVANAATVLGFGVLAFSRVPVLSALGTTVAPGTFLALLFAAALSRSAFVSSSA
jgi:predicted exporter